MTDLNVVSVVEESDMDSVGLGKAVQRLSIDDILKKIEYIYLSSDYYENEIKATVANTKGMFYENSPTLKQNYENMIYYLANILIAYDSDGVDMAITEFVESNMENGFDVSPKHQEMFDNLISLKYGDIKGYEKMATAYGTPEQPSSGQGQSLPSGRDLYTMKMQITGTMKEEPLGKVTELSFNHFDLKEIRALGAKSRALRCKS